MFGHRHSVHEHQGIAAEHGGIGFERLSRHNLQHRLSVLTAYMDLSYVFDYGLAHRREAGVVVHFIYGHGASLEKQVGTQLQTVHIFVDAEVTADLHSHAPAFQIFGDRAVQMQFRHPVSVQFRACKRAEHLQTEIVVDVAGVQFEDQVPVAVYISGIEGNQTGTVHGGAVDVVSQPRAGKHGGHAAVHRRNAYGDYLTFIFGDAELRIRAQRRPVSGTGFEKIGEAGTFRVWQSVAYAQGKTEVQAFSAAVAPRCSITRPAGAAVPYGRPFPSTAAPYGRPVPSTAAVAASPSGTTLSCLEALRVL